MVVKIVQIAVRIALMITLQFFFASSLITFYFLFFTFKSEAPLRGLLLRLWNWVLNHELEVALRAESTRLELSLASHGVGGLGVLRGEDTLSVLDVLLDREVLLSESSR